MNFRYFFEEKHKAFYVIKKYFENIFSTKEVTASTSTAPNLQALLNSEVEPTSNNVGTGSLLERLVSGQAITSPAASTSSGASPAPSIRSNADSTNEITLAALLSKPVQNMSPLAASPGSQMGSPTKASPLIQVIALLKMSSFQCKFL